MRNKILCSIFLVLMGLGYLSAVVNLFLKKKDLDLDGQLTVTDVITDFHGNDRLTRLTIAINTTMREHLDSQAEVETIEHWVFNGVPRDVYDEKIGPLIEKRCIECHDLFGEAEFLPLTSYEKVVETTKPYAGKSWQALTELSHQHFFGMGFIFFLSGTVLFRTDRWSRWKVLLVCLGFIGILADVTGWTLTKLWAPGAYIVMSSGAIHGTAFLGIFLTSVYEMWIYERGKNVE